MAHVYPVILMWFMNMYKYYMLLRYKVVINGLKKAQNLWKMLA